MSKKCICFCRVSTLAQDLAAQKERVVATAIADGYREDEIAVVEGKESAIKLKEEERQTIAEMKQIIADNPSIESVYVFAIDRLARRVSVILSVKDYLTEHGINLVFLNPHKMGTLKVENGVKKEDELTNLLLMLLSYGADMEMKIKKERFQTAKNALRKQGKIASGRVLYGYVKLPDNTIGINEEEAKIIRYIYQLYLNEDISLQGVFMRLVSEGIWEKNIQSRSIGTKVRMILTNPAYCGGPPKQRSVGKEGIVRTEKYPAIISEEIQHEVIAKLKGNKKKAKTSTKTIYYGKGLVKYLLPNGKEYTMSPIRRNIQYSIKTDDLFASVNCNVIDTILWNEAMHLKSRDLFLDKKKAKETYIHSIKENERIIASIRPKLDDVNVKQQKAFRMYVNGGVSEEIYNSIMSEISSNSDMYSKQIAKLETANANMQMMIKEIDSSQYVRSTAIGEITDDEERVKIIKSVIEKVLVTRMNEGKRVYIIRIIPTDVLMPFYDENEFYKYYVSGGVFHLSSCYRNRSRDISKYIIKRIKQYPRVKQSNR